MLQTELTDWPDKVIPVGPPGVVIATDILPSLFQGQLVSKVFYMTHIHTHTLILTHSYSHSHTDEVHYLWSCVSQKRTILGPVVRFP